MFQNFVTDKSGINSARGSTIYVRGYERAYELRRLRSLPANQVMNTLYPRLYILHQLDDGDGEPYQLMEGLNIIKMPPIIPSLSEVIFDSNFYIFMSYF